MLENDQTRERGQVLRFEPNLKCISRFTAHGRSATFHFGGLLPVGCLFFATQFYQHEAQTTFSLALRPLNANGSLLPKHCAISDVA
jgi:hypothetical protein